MQALSQQLEYQQSQHERETEEIRKAASIDKESALRIHKSAVCDQSCCDVTNVIIDIVDI